MKERIKQLRIKFQKSKDKDLKSPSLWDRLLALLFLIEDENMSQDGIKVLLGYFEEQQAKSKEVNLFGCYAATLHHVLGDGVLESRFARILERRNELQKLDKLWDVKLG